MAIRTVVTRGFGNGTFNGTIPLVTLRGYVAAAITADSSLYATTSCLPSLGSELFANTSLSGEPNIYPSLDAKPKVRLPRS